VLVIAAIKENLGTIKGIILFFNSDHFYVLQETHLAGLFIFLELLTAFVEWFKISLFEVLLNLTI